jgi:hypothetical protein
MRVVLQHEKDESHSEANLYLVSLTVSPAKTLPPRNLS